MLLCSWDSQLWAETHIQLQDSYGPFMDRSHISLSGGRNAVYWENWKALILNLSQHQGLFSELALRIRWPKYWSFSFSISPSSEYSGLISFSLDWFDLIAVQRTLKSLLQHHNLKASILQCSAFFMVQL